MFSLEVLLLECVSAKYTLPCEIDVDPWFRLNLKISILVCMISSLLEGKLMRIIAMLREKAK